MKKILMSDNAKRIYSVIAAIFLWFFVIYSQNPESTRKISDIPVSYTNLAELEKAGYTVVRPDEEQSISLTVIGKRLSIGDVDRESVSVSAEIPKFEKGTYDVPLNIVLPTDEVAIKDKSVSVISVTVDKLVSKSFDIETVDSASEDASSATVYSLSSKSVTITGPKCVLEQIGRVYVKTENRGKDETVKYQIMAEGTDKTDMTKNPNLKFSSDSVKVTSKTYRVKDVAITADFKNEPAEGYGVSEVKITPEKIRVGTDNDEILEIDSIKTDKIDLSGKTESFSVSANVLIPENSISLDGEEVQVNVSIEKTKTANITVDAKDIVPINMSKTIKEYNIVTPSVEVTVEAAESLMDAAGDNITVSASVDLSAVKTGNNYLPLNIELPNGFFVKKTPKILINVN